DGIRDATVTGVQTCALPICLLPQLHGVGSVVLLGEIDDLGLLRLLQQLGEALRVERLGLRAFELDHGVTQLLRADGLFAAPEPRSEERRVGKVGGTWEACEQ